MLTLCPQCRAPSNVHQKSCWVCKRDFDGSEPRIGDVPFSRRPLAYSERVAPAWLATERAELHEDSWEDLSGRQAFAAGRR
jgi:hypothetical protein